MGEGTFGLTRHMLNKNMSCNKGARPGEEPVKTDKSCCHGLVDPNVHALIDAQPMGVSYF